MQYFLASFDTTVVSLGGRSNLTTVRMHQETWVVRAQIDPETEPLAIMRWSWSFYQAMTQLLAISVGIVEPRRPAELWINLASILCGAALYAFFVGMRAPIRRTDPTHPPNAPELSLTHSLTPSRPQPACDGASNAVTCRALSRVDAFLCPPRHVLAALSVLHARSSQPG